MRTVTGDRRSASGSGCRRVTRDSCAAANSVAVTTTNRFVVIGGGRVGMSILSGGCRSPAVGGRMRIRHIISGVGCMVTGPGGLCPLAMRAASCTVTRAADNCCVCPSGGTIHLANLRGTGGLSGSGSSI